MKMVVLFIKLIINWFVVFRLICVMKKMDECEEGMTNYIITVFLKDNLIEEWKMFRKRFYFEIMKEE